MRVGLNLIFLVPGETGGMETVARELIPELARQSPHELVAFVNEESRGEDFGVEQVVVPVRASRRVEWVRGEQQLLPRLAAGCDLVHSLGGTGPARGDFLRAVTIHDLHYRTVPEAHFGLRGLGMRVLVPLAARASHAILTVSHASRAEIVRLLGVPPEKVAVVHNGLGRRLDGPAPTPAAELRRMYWLEDRAVLLAMSAKRPHKNLAGLLDALALLDPRPVLVLPGYPTGHERELRAQVRRLGVEGDVRFVGWVSDADAEGLYALADAFVHPAFSEGFGLPVLEAIARGVPTACSDIAVLREVAGEDAIFFDPRSPASIAEGVRAALERPRGPGAVRFTWEAAAARTLEVYETLSRQRMTSCRRPRS